MKYLIAFILLGIVSADTTACPATRLRARTVTRVTTVVERVRERPGLFGRRAAPAIVVAVPAATGCKNGVCPAKK